MGLLEHLASGFDSFFGKDWFVVETLRALQEDSENLSPDSLKSQAEALIPRLRTKPNLPDREKHLSEAHTLLARALQRKGLYKEALVPCQEALRLDSRNPQAEKYLAVSWAAEGNRTREAAETYRRVIARGGAQATVYWALADICLTSHDGEPSAVRAYQDALARGWIPAPAPTPRLAEVLARLLYAQEKYEGATEQLALFSGPQAPTQLLLSYARLLILTDQHEAASGVLQWLDRRADGRPWAHLLRAQTALLAWRPAVALRELQAPEAADLPEAQVLRWTLDGVAAGEAPPPGATAANYLAAGLTCMRARNFVRAGEVLGRPAHCNALATEAGYWGAWAALAAGRLAEANATFDRVRSRLEPALLRSLERVLDPLNHYTAALTEATCNRWTAAAAHMDQASQNGFGPMLRARLAGPLYLRAGLEMWRQDSTAALRHLEAAARECSDLWGRHALEILSEAHPPCSPVLLKDFSSAEPPEVLRWLRTQSVPWSMLPPDQALAELRKATDRGLSVPAAFCWGVLLSFQANDETAQREWSQQLMALPTATRCHKERVGFLQLCRSLRSGQCVPLQALRDTAPGEGPARALALFVLAFRAYFERKHELALEAAEAALARHEDRKCILPGTLVGELRNLQVALAGETGRAHAVEGMPDLREDSPQALQNLALLAEIQSRDAFPLWDAALTAWQASGSGAPYIEQVIIAARRRLIRRCMETESWAQASHQCHQLLRLRPDDRETLTGLTVALRCQEKFAEARSAAERLIRMEPDSIRPRLLLVDVLFFGDGPDETISYLESLRPEFGQDIDYIRYCNDLMCSADTYLQECIEKQQWEASFLFCTRLADLALDDVQSCYFKVRGATILLLCPVTGAPAIDHARSVLREVDESGVSDDLARWTGSLERLIDCKQWDLKYEQTQAKLNALVDTANAQIDRLKEAGTIAERTNGRNTFNSILGQLARLEAEIDLLSREAARVEVEDSMGELTAFFNHVKSSAREVLHVLNG